MKFINRCKILTSLISNVTWTRSLYYGTNSLLGLDQIKRNIKKEPDSNEKSLPQDLALQIKAGGPLNIAEYMRFVLTHPFAGYYMNKDVFGTKGDFITSPEVSQLFGEMIAIWIVNEWRKIHKGPIQLIELGPGRGTLSHHILKAFDNLRVLDKVSLHLVEISPALREKQKLLLCEDAEFEFSNNESTGVLDKGMTTDDVQVFWYNSIFDIPDGFSVIIANEFFDAIPIHKFQKKENKWFEVLVDVDPTSSDVEPKFRFILSNSIRCNLLVKENETRDQIEISPELLRIFRHLSDFLMRNGGFSLIIDYGHMGEKTDTFRAFRQHKQCNPLSIPGSADLTADVDFSLIRQLIEEEKKLSFFGPVLQKDFLQKIGIDVRLKLLLEYASKEDQELLKCGYDKIVNDMGTKFKAISLFPIVLKDFLTKHPVVGFH